MEDKNGKQKTGTARSRSRQMSKLYDRTRLSMELWSTLTVLVRVMKLENEYRLSKNIWQASSVAMPSL